MLAEVHLVALGMEDFLVVTVCFGLGRRWVLLVDLSRGHMDRGCSRTPTVHMQHTTIRECGARIPAVVWLYKGPK